MNNVHNEYMPGKNYALEPDPPKLEAVIADMNYWFRATELSGDKEEYRFMAIPRVPLRYMGADLAAHERHPAISAVYAIFRTGFHFFAVAKPAPREDGYVPEGVVDVYALNAGASPTTPGRIEQVGFIWPGDFPQYQIGRIFLPKVYNVGIAGEDRAASNHHCEVGFDAAGGLYIADNNTLNGTQVWTHRDDPGGVHVHTRW